MGKCPCPLGASPPPRGSGIRSSPSAVAWISRNCCPSSADSRWATLVICTSRQGHRVSGCRTHDGEVDTARGKVWETLAQESRDLCITMKMTRTEASAPFLIGPPLGVLGGEGRKWDSSRDRWPLRIPSSLGKWIWAGPRPLSTQEAHTSPVSHGVPCAHLTESLLGVAKGREELPVAPS